jgi:thiamine pyrophosphate-dependent acetolactate synthase large subunit-like protein
MRTRSPFWVGLAVLVHTSTDRGCEQAASSIVHAAARQGISSTISYVSAGMTGLLGFASVDHAMMNRETLLMLGADFVSAVLPRTSHDYSA